jgi:hexokinase
MAELYPHFNERLHDTLVVLLGEALTKRVRIGLAKDGSGVGAALAALQAKKDLDSIKAAKK